MEARDVHLMGSDEDFKDPLMPILVGIVTALICMLSWSVIYIIES